MTDRRQEIQTMLDERLTLIQAIAAANCEQLRLNQIASGIMILDQKDEIEGAETDLRRAERDANTDARQLCMARIETLESQLADLDRALVSASKKDEK